MNLAGKKAIVTGGSGGYGKGIAAAFKQAGAEVWITGRNEQKLQAAAAELGVHAVPADVTSGKDWDNVMKQAGSVDILINNAGGGGTIHPLSEQSDEEIISAINNNLTGTLLGCARAAKIMQQKKSGLIVNISSVCALYAWPAWSVYTAAKAGLSKFSHGLYTELRPYGVRVFCDRAGCVRALPQTPQLRAAAPLRASGYPSAYRAALKRGTRIRVLPHRAGVRTLLNRAVSRPPRLFPDHLDPR